MDVIQPILDIYKYNVFNPTKIVTFSEEKVQLDYIIILQKTKPKYKPRYKRFINTRLSDHYMIGLEI